MSSRAPGPAWGVSGDGEDARTGKILDSILDASPGPRLLVIWGYLLGGQLIGGAAGRVEATGETGGGPPLSVPCCNAGPPSCRSRCVTSLMATTTRLSRKVVSLVPSLPPLSTATGLIEPCCRQ